MVVIEPSVDVDDGGAGSVKQARLAFSRCAADIVPHTSTVSVDVRMSDGRLFHARGPATANARSSMVERRVGGTTSVAAH